LLMVAVATGLIRSFRWSANAEDEADAPRLPRMQDFARCYAPRAWQRPYPAVMRPHIPPYRPQRATRIPRQIARPVARPKFTRTQPSIPSLDLTPSAHARSTSAEFQPNPYLDYGRFLTPQGGVLIIYKDIDTRLRHTLWRVFAWTVSTGYEVWFVLYYSPLQNEWINIACLLAVAALNGFIVAKPVELYRRIEIRPDCMILEGSEVFWLRLMESDWPTLQPDEEGNQVLRGIYGTRLVEYLTIRRFDDYDRMPEVIGAHLQEAMEQLWGAAIATGTVQSNSGPRQRR
jgi:hypothetical protein